VKPNRAPKGGGLSRSNQFIDFAPASAVPNAGLSGQHRRDSYHSITSYRKATPSGSLALNQRSAASGSTNAFM
jgi:hypothetical protein